jgi:hypothetical protein
METRECNIPGWKPADIGLFYPDMPYIWGTAEVVEKEDKVYYRSVYQPCTDLKAFLFAYLPIHELLMAEPYLR